MAFFRHTDLLLKILRWWHHKGGGERGRDVIDPYSMCFNWLACGAAHPVARVDWGKGWEVHLLSMCNVPSEEGCLRDSKDDVNLEASEGKGEKGITHENCEPALKEQTQDEDTELSGCKIPHCGNGITFTLGVLDELVGRAVRSHLAPNPQHGTVKTIRVIWCWCICSYGAICWFAPYLHQIATLAALPSSHINLKIRIFLTCLSDPITMPKILRCTLTEVRPSVGQVLERLLDNVLVPGADCCGKLDLIHSKGEYRWKVLSVSAFMDNLLADLEKGGAGVEEGEAELSRSGSVAFCSPTTASQHASTVPAS
ncbi:hypothetical protein DFH08DRAFT_821782 [Mycena albidolilacea]|uniref:Uncharacterized protein n=1 Tax=Mycena albidolilacea TaxID=1033008 RepID=A0AAD7EDV4_9AGAR|nr:hypothetical protein DFH08DRAFT_821782 [Mycena albidolilacea]